MKKNCAVLCIMILLMILPGLMLAEQAAWICPVCGNTLSQEDNFCGADGHPAPWKEDESTEEESLPQSEETQQQIEKQEEVPVLSEAFPGKTAHIRLRNDETERIYSRTGPGKAYVSSGAYKPYKIKSVTVYYEEDGWVFTDLLVSEERFLYIPKYEFDQLERLPAFSELAYYRATATERVLASWGPDNRFTYSDKLAVEKGTKLKVFFQENGFVFAEYESGEGLTRMWLPADKIEVEGALVTLVEDIHPSGQSTFDTNAR